MARHVMAVDLGSTGIKVAVVDETGRVRSSAGEVIPLVFTADGGVEQDPHLWWSALGRCARHATADAGCTAGDITLVAVTSQYTSTVPVATWHAFSGQPLQERILSSSLMSLQ